MPCDRALIDLPSVSGLFTSQNLDSFETSASYRFWYSGNRCIARDRNPAEYSLSGGLSLYNDRRHERAGAGPLLYGVRPQVRFWWHEMLFIQGGVNLGFSPNNLERPLVGWNFQTGLRVPVAHDKGVSLVLDMISVSLDYYPALEGSPTHPLFFTLRDYNMMVASVLMFVAMFASGGAAH